jgi:DNA-binding transcriptional regulator YdaS (Cro superfamily)
MTLKQWLQLHKPGYRAFAKRIGVANAGVVQKYAAGRVPRSAQVRDAIVRETSGQVQLVDLYAAAGR